MNEVSFILSRNNPTVRQAFPAVNHMLGEREMTWPDVKAQYAAMYGDAPVAGRRYQTYLAGLLFQLVQKGLLLILHDGGGGRHAGEPVDVFRIDAPTVGIRDEQARLLYEMVVVPATEPNEIYAFDALLAACQQHIEARAERIPIFIDEALLAHTLLQVAPAGVVRLS